MEAISGWDLVFREKNGVHLSESCFNYAAAIAVMALLILIFSSNARLMAKKKKNEIKDFLENQKTCPEFTVEPTENAPYGSENGRFLLEAMKNSSPMNNWALPFSILASLLPY